MYGCRGDWVHVFRSFYSVVPFCPLIQNLFDVLEAEPRRRSYAFSDNERPKPKIRRRSRSLRSHRAVNPIKVEVPRYFLRGSGLNSYHVYEIKVREVLVSGLLTWGWWYFKVHVEQLSSWHYNNYHATTLLVQIQLGSDQWSVYKRYSNFRQFHEEIKKKYPQVYICDKIVRLFVTSVYSWNCITYTKDGLCAALTNMLMVQFLQGCQIDIILIDM